MFMGLWGTDMKTTVELPEELFVAAKSLQRLSRDPRRL
jgi:hypothetical protein